MEETIGYEALLESDQWAAVLSGDWSDVSVEDWGQGGGEPEDSELSTHEVTVCDPSIQDEGNEDRFGLECDACGSIGTADSAQEAEAIARLHEAFVATLVEKWSVDR